MIRKGKVGVFYFYFTRQTGFVKPFSTRGAKNLLIAFLFPGQSLALQTLQILKTCWLHVQNKKGNSLTSRCKFEIFKVHFSFFLLLKVRLFLYLNFSLKPLLIRCLTHSLLLSAVPISERGNWSTAA